MFIYTSNKRILSFLLAYGWQETIKTISISNKFVIHTGEMTKTEDNFGLHECSLLSFAEPIYPPLFNGQHFCQNLGHKDKKVCRIMWLPAVGLQLLTVHYIFQILYPIMEYFSKKLSFSDIYITTNNLKSFNTLGVTLCCYGVILCMPTFYRKLSEEKYIKHVQVYTCG